ncbi:hypothetical protein FPE01S_08_00270 [Flavihumibacter petaseus NBRC 106054]|uniref:Acyl-CoA reductase n=1 Tax=Flavihumibacter petaseus NBRC 106054 TaxID=1220578 RepID=A0A0E9N6Y3_9BACT|nr:hypothetical protein FPE01S_08_00270 [Flavihumibacter petaseus NBRC 106054]
MGIYLRENPSEWQEIKTRASLTNPWFSAVGVEEAVTAIADNFLQADLLRNWADAYVVPSDRPAAKTVGIVMAGNIPLVGFHDWLAVFVSGHNSKVKLSSKDAVLLPHLVKKLEEWEPGVAGYTSFAEQLKSCDAYIATGSDNTSRYFEYYFGKYPSIIRRNRTSVAVLDGSETAGELVQLADDTHQYFGMGCRNVTHLYVPEGYDFLPFLNAAKKYSSYFDHPKYKNNYDYQLAILLLNHQYYMSNGSVLLVENPAIFSPISVIHYSYYPPGEMPLEKPEHNNSIQCIVGHGHIPFGSAQEPGLSDYADGVDTMQFLSYL